MDSLEYSITGTEQQATTAGIEAAAAAELLEGFPQVVALKLEESEFAPGESNSCRGIHAYIHMNT